MRRFFVLLLFIFVLFGLNQMQFVLSEPQTHPLPVPKFQKGYSYLLYGFEELKKEEYWFLKKTVKLYNHLNDQNVNSIAIVFPISQDGFGSSFVRTDTDITPPKETIRIAIREAHKRNMIVLLRPILDESNFNDADGEWRGIITPQDKKQWMKSYTKVIVDYASFAEEEKVEILGIGTELTSMLSEQDEWDILVAEVRKVYKGKIIYSFNWDDNPNPRFVAELDYIGIDSFYPIQEPTASEWEPWIEKMKRYEAYSGKDVIFTELGTQSQVDSFKSPWGWKTVTTVDQEGQMKYYESLCQASTHVVDGWYVWHVTVNSLEINPETDPSFDPTRKKAEKSIRDCYTRI